MIQVKVHFKAITDVYTFVGIVSKYPFEVDMCSGRYIIDAKSIMGVFSLDLLSDIQLNIYSDGFMYKNTQIRLFLLKNVFF